jgi:hypothetical protein
MHDILDHDQDIQPLYSPAYQPLYWLLIHMGGNHDIVGKNQGFEKLKVA